MKIISTEFLVGAVSAKQYPKEPLPEFAFAGRSNVGKSSLIKSLLNRKKLVRISSTPGKTREINFFKINKCCKKSKESFLFYKKSPFHT